MLLLPRPHHIPRLLPRITLRFTSTTPKSYYDLFPRTLPNGPPPSGPFTIDLPSLRREFFALQQLAHPDVSHQTPNTSPTVPSSAYINTAYRTLLDPLTRAQHILHLRGIDVAGDEGITADGGEEDGGLLMEVLEAREEVEGAEGKDEVEEVWRRNEDRIGGCVRRLGEMLEGGDLQAARREVVRLRYWRNVREALEEKGAGH
ncbi:Co-chaperone Hsc20 [Ascodesmis nigricans]|uniref:Co-chaperone Hsc20 n=1 Tax=Ascodesmis nigricans TaxID=341454 RepID=A0A4S2N7U3_9PEZI|nr:Co-chaperone Hsc20 [Ascodesmis nigricans]